MINKINLKNIFWEYKFTNKDVDEIFNGTDFPKKKFLFEKILLNSKNMILDLEKFSTTDLRKLLNDYMPPKFNQEYALRRKAIAESYFFQKAMTIVELRWKP